MKKTRHLFSLLLVAVISLSAVFGYVLIKKGPNLFTSLLDYTSVQVEESVENLDSTLNNSNVPSAPFTRKEIDCVSSSASVAAPDVEVDTDAITDSFSLTTGYETDLDTGVDVGTSSDDGKCYLVYKDKSSSVSNWKGVALLVVPPFERWGLVGGNLPSVPAFSTPKKAWGPSQGAIDAFYGTSSSSSADSTVFTTVTAKAIFKVGADAFGVESSISLALEDALEEANSSFREYTYGTNQSMHSDVDSIEDHGVVVARTRYYDYKYEIEGGGADGDTVVLSLPYAGETQLWDLEDYNAYNDSNDLLFTPGKHVVGSVDSYPSVPTYSLLNASPGDEILDDSSLYYSPNLTGMTTWEYSVTSGNSSSQTRSKSVELGTEMTAFGTGMSSALAVGGGATHTVSVSTSSKFGGSFGYMSKDCKDEGWDYAMTPYIYWERFNTSADYPYELIVLDYYVREKGSAYSDANPVKTCQDSPFSMVLDPTLNVYVPVDEYLAGISAGVDTNGAELDTDTQYDVDKLLDDLLIVDGDQLAVKTSVLNQIYDLQGLQVNLPETVGVSAVEEENNTEGEEWSPLSDVAQYVKASEVKQKLGRKLSAYIHEDAKFTDLKEKDEHFVAVQYLAQNNILDGYDDGTFKPKNKVNRAEAIKIILEGLDISEVESGDTQTYEFKFPDASPQSWYAKYLKYAVDNGILVGYPDGRIKLDKTVNKVEFLKMLFESAGLDVAEVGTLSAEEMPSDVSSDSWYLPYVTFALDNGLVDLEDGYFNPGAELSRGDASEIVYRFFMLLLE